MASALIQEIRTISGNQPAMRRLPEKAAQTWQFGTPVQEDPVTGYVQAWDGVTIASGIAGIAKEPGANLASNGVAQQQALPGAAGQVQNQSSAVQLSRPYFNDGKTGFIVANDDTVFSAQVGPAQTTAQSDLGKQYGLTKDTDGHWYVDKNKTGGSAVVTIVKLDQYDVTRGVHFVFNRGTNQLGA